ncbi:MAG: hypothetical protein A2X67_02685 [Ignavibacteria bacterium GWA2_55_11]|nr:MAG: hypothetical protein A2X67_02685 [Ignavibacteria bacterium GWA2_55_11]OGU46293.1 MAG: hypothetical protein A2X68_06690 [Ignavibacteria bacterium GWC2_56_12]OGU63975.1 MAG: hypothetical protein A3C56_09050 [Ignavibacteria bacterium RIFCSPHIGHO2_02_FULL_56_12]OGU71551.1 MAG: hypothetical protein A3G43_11855 [Ignavibacteria bacterium RIFCSPLOWO2_12_FULL_56_21]OGU72447.1 MAG: hypothetical protein A3H45_12920 [Ignavibacteria bacterium RIFCSPLOWO2_02_FULL_55_14]
MKTLIAMFFLVFASTVSQVRSGADVLLSERMDLIKGKKLGIVTNHSALLSDGRHLVDALARVPDVKVVVLFGPEHGIRGNAPDGRSIRDTVDAATGAPIFSLYGRINKPTSEMLKDVDVLIYDIQDVGVRFYTYSSTLSLAMEAAAEKGIPYIVLDRPNPIRGTWVEGFVREDSLKSFVGLHPITIAHGMTLGEFATMINGEKWLKDGVKANLTVVKCAGWKRDMWYDQTGLAWVKPSPNMAELSTATVYPGTCLFEGTNLSEGRGTPKPFEYIGAPYVDAKAWASALNAAKLPGVTFEPIEFTTASIANTTNNPKYKGLLSHGVYVHVTDRNVFEPVRSTVHMLVAARKLFGDKFQWRSSINRLSGTSRLATMIDAGKTAEEITGVWRAEQDNFRSTRQKYLLY